jgi:hypothetical protein
VPLTKKAGANQSFQLFFYGWAKYRSSCVDDQPNTAAEQFKILSSQTIDRADFVLYNMLNLVLVDLILVTTVHHFYRKDPDTQVFGLPTSPEWQEPL